MRLWEPVGEEAKGMGERQKGVLFFLNVGRKA